MQHSFATIVATSMKHYILDAHNILHKHPQWRRLIEQRELRQARQALVDAIVQLAERYPAFFFTLVFDGINTSVRAPYRNIAVYEAPRGTPADVIIKQRIDADPHPRQCIIVSSDTEVHNYARRSGCTVMAAHDFLQELQKPRYDKSSDEFALLKSGSAEKPSALSASEREEFRRLFGVRNE
jgi:predicted RNA-binding protein with PIN domain